MKILTGKYKGRVLEGFTIDGTRPTMDRVKESIFAMIQNKIEDSIILDLFSGSGNLGIEALSEGASEAYLVDHNMTAIKTIKKNIQKIGINQVECLHLDYKKALQYLKKKELKFDLIFLDPPYQTNYIEESIKIIEKLDLLNKDGIIICESDKLEKIIYSENWNSIREKKYGDKYVVLLEKMC